MDDHKAQGNGLPVLHLHRQAAESIEMSKHIHAELMAQYAQDAMETDKPHERWQFKTGEIEWSNYAHGNPSWDIHYQYRRKLKHYEPTLLDQALELEIEAMMKRATHYGLDDAYGVDFLNQYQRMKTYRSPAMIEHLKSQGKL